MHSWTDWLTLTSDFVVEDKSQFEFFFFYCFYIQSHINAEFTQLSCFEKGIQSWISYSLCALRAVYSEGSFFHTLHLLKKLWHYNVFILSIWE